MAVVLAGCPEKTPQTMTTMTTPSPDLSVSFHIEPPGTQVVTTPPQTLTYRVIVDSKGQLNLGVEFETFNVKPMITATVNPTRISETARETQLVVQVPAGTRPDDYDFTLRARLAGPGPGGPDWTPTIVPLRVSSNEGSFSLTCPAELAIAAGQAASMPCRTIRDAGFIATIDLSFTNRPGNITIFPESVSVGPDVGGFSFTVVREAAPATSSFIDLVTMGRSAGLTRQSTTRIHFP